MSGVIPVVTALAKKDFLKYRTGPTSGNDKSGTNAVASINDGYATDKLF